MQENSPAKSRQLGKYRIERELGRGATSVVYLAFDTVHQKPVALKVLTLSHTASVQERRDANARFVREARAIGAIHHPCVPAFYEAGVLDGAEFLGTAFLGTSFLAMEFCDGQTLRSLLNNGGPRKLPDALWIAHNVLAGLRAAHEKGVCHRDVKPENIILRPDGSLKLVDFGSARDVADAGALTRTGSMMGTPAYMSPEQASGSAVDARSDLFSVAIVLHEMLTGRRPFGDATGLSGALLGTTGNNVLATLHAVCYSEPTLVSTLPPFVLSALSRALQKKPEERFQSATHFAAALYDAEGNRAMRDTEETLAALPARRNLPSKETAPPVRRPIARPLRQSGGTRQRKAVAAFAAVTALCLATLALFAALVPANRLPASLNGAVSRVAGLWKAPAGAGNAKPAKKSVSSRRRQKATRPAAATAGSGKNWLPPREATPSTPTASVEQAAPSRRRCAVCHGTGVRACPTCHGTGYVRSAGADGENGENGEDGAVCPVCLGTGKQECPACDGEGWVEVKTTPGVSPKKRF